MRLEAKQQDNAIQNEQEYVVQSYSRPPFVIERGDGMTLYDTDGNHYTDWVSGIAVNALGYNDAGIAEAMQQQLATGVMHLSNLYHSDPHAKLAKLLVEKSFADRVFFVNSGAEANEAAIKFARKVSYMNDDHDRKNIVTFTGGFHGRTMGALAVTPREKYQKAFRPLMPGVTVAEFNNIESAKNTIDTQTAAVIVEPIQGEGGVNVADPEFLQAVRAFCDENGALLIFDEIQCGVGRTGKLWAYEHYGVTPDMMTLAKPLAGGLPMGAILMTQQVADAIKPGDHGSTFAGGLAVSAVACHVVERIAEPDFLAHVAEVGEYVMERLEELNSPMIKEVRGKGLMVAMELTHDAAPLIKQGYAHNLLLVNAGENVMRFVPPLIAEKSDVDHLINELTRIMEQIDD